MTIDGLVKADVDFEAAYTATFPVADKTKAYTLHRGGDCSRRPQGYKGWSKTFTGSSTPCQPPPPQCASTVQTSDVSARYVTDDFHALVEYKGMTLCEGVSKTVSLNSYKTDGPTWPTSGTQVFVDHDQITIDKNTTSGTLVVDKPSCYYQTDLYWGSTRYDGVDGALPHYPNSPTPNNLIAARNGGTACQVVEPTGSFTVKCSATGAQADVGMLSQGSYSGGSFKLVWTGGSVTVTSGQQNVTVPASSAITLQYVRQGDQPKTLDTEQSPAACPPYPVQPSGQFTTECTATGAQADVGTLSAGGFPGGTFQLVSGQFSATVTSGQQNVTVPASSAITLQYVRQGDQPKTLDTEQSPAACPPPVQPSGQFTTECTATGAQADVGTLSAGGFPGGTFQLVSGQFSATVTSGQQNVTVPASSAITLQYVRQGDQPKTLDTEQSPAPCPPAGDVVKTSVPATGSVVPAGSTIAYTVTVSNTGTVPIVNAPVVDTLPTFVTAVAGTVSDSGVVSGDGRTITWTVSLPVGGSKALTYTGLVGANAPPSSQLVNKATFLLKESTTTHVVGSGALSLTKAVTPVAGNGVVVEFGDTLTYTLTAAATGTLSQPNVVITDYLPGSDPARPSSGETTYVAGSAACVGAGTCTVTGPDANGLITWTLGDMAPGTSRQVTFKVVIVDVAGEAGETVAVDILNAGAVKSDRTPVTPSNEVVTPVSKVLGVKVPNEEQPPTGPGTQPSVLPHTGAGIPLGTTVYGGVGLVAMGLILTAASRRRRGPVG